VLWPSERLFAVLSQAGLPVTLPYLDDLARRWSEDGGTQQSPLWRKAHDLAGHMLAQWPRQGGYGRRKAPSDAARLLAALTQLDDTAAIEGFLIGVIAEDGFGMDDNDAIIGALGRLPPARRPPPSEPAPTCWSGRRRHGRTIAPPTWCRPPPGWSKRFRVIRRMPLRADRGRTASRWMRASWSIC